MYFLPKNMSFLRKAPVFDGISKIITLRNADFPLFSGFAVTPEQHSADSLAPCPPGPVTRRGFARQQTVRQDSPSCTL